MIEARAKSSTAATAPVNAESAKSSRRVRKNDEEKIEKRWPCAEYDGGRGQISCEQKEQHGRKARFDERVRVASEDRVISTTTKENRDQAGREQFVGDEGRERRQGGVLRELVVIDRPDEAGGERCDQEDQNEDEGLQASQDEHAPPLADENLAVEQALKRRLGRVSGIGHLDLS